MVFLIYDLVIGTDVDASTGLIIGTSERKTGKMQQEVERTKGISM